MLYIRTVPRLNCIFILQCLIIDTIDILIDFMYTICFDILSRLHPQEKSFSYLPILYPCNCVYSLRRNIAYMDVNINISSSQTRSMLIEKLSRQPLLEIIVKCILAIRK